jgi:hypothetical protein
MPRLTNDSVGARSIASPGKARNNPINKPFPWKGWLRINAVIIALVVLFRLTDTTWSAIGVFLVLTSVPANLLVIVHGARGRGEVLLTFKPTRTKKILIGSYLLAAALLPFLIDAYEQGMPAERIMLALLVILPVLGGAFALGLYLRPIRRRQSDKTAKDLPDVM